MYIQFSHLLYFIIVKIFYQITNSFLYFKTIIDMSKIPFFIYKLLIILFYLLICRIKIFEVFSYL